jgi:hypothetical protein
MLQEAAHELVAAQAGGLRRACRGAPRARGLTPLGWFPAGIGAEFATVLTRKVFYRPFQNRRQVASYVGLTPVGARPDYRYDVAAGGAPSLCCAAAITSGAGNLAQKRE